jgi:hypothetical protein
MTNQMTASRSSSRILKRGALAAVAAVALVLGGAAAGASAYIDTPTAPASTGDGTWIWVDGYADSGSANEVAVAICNSTAGGLLGTHCDGANAVGDIDVDPVTGYWGEWLFVERTFANTNLSTGGSTGGSTTCGASGQQCQIQYSEYATWPPTSGPLSTGGIDITVTP